MDICVHINGASPDVNNLGKIQIAFLVSGTNGGMLSGEVTIDFAASAQTTNNAIIDAAKARCTQMFGTAFGQGHRVMLLAGRV